MVSEDEDVVAAVRMCIRVRARPTPCPRCVCVFLGVGGISRPLDTAVPVYIQGQHLTEIGSVTAIHAHVPFWLLLDRSRSVGMEYHIDRDADGHAWRQACVVRGVSESCTGSSVCRCAYATVGAKVNCSHNL
jgi:hypothetical protein